MNKGIKETKEAMVAGNELGIFLASRFKDGIGADDFTAFVAKVTADPAFQKILKDAYEGASEIGAEVRDVDLQEGLELAALQLSYIPRYVEALKVEP